MTTKSLSITVLDKPHAVPMPGRPRGTEYSCNEVSQSSRLEKEAPYKLVTLKISVTLLWGRKLFLNSFGS